MLIPSQVEFCSTYEYGSSAYTVARSASISPNTDNWWFLPEWVWISVQAWTKRLRYGIISFVLCPCSCCQISMFQIFYLFYNMTTSLFSGSLLLSYVRLQSWTSSTMNPSPVPYATFSVKDIWPSQWPFLTALLEKFKVIETKLKTGVSGTVPYLLSCIHYSERPFVCKH